MSRRILTNKILLYFIEIKTLLPQLSLPEYFTTATLLFDINNPMQ